MLVGTNLLWRVESSLTVMCVPSSKLADRHKTGFHSGKTLRLMFVEGVTEKIETVTRK